MGVVIEAVFDTFRPNFKLTEDQIRSMQADRALIDGIRLFLGNAAAEVTREPMKSPKRAMILRLAAIAGSQPE